MTGRFSGLFLGLSASFTAPRMTARGLIDRPFTASDILSATAVLAIAVTFLNLFVARLAGPGAAAEPLQRFIAEQPMLMALIQFVSVPVGASISLGLARLFGGTGSFRNTMVASIWLNAMVVVLQLVFLVLHRFLGPAQPLFLVAGIIWWLVAYAGALCEIHGFRSIAMVIGAMIGIFMAFIILMYWFAISFGLVAPVAP
jgi:hypothetical protein